MAKIQLNGKKVLFKSNDTISNALEKAFKGELDLSSSKLCNF